MGTHPVGTVQTLSAPWNLLGPPLIPEKNFLLLLPAVDPPILSFAIHTDAHQPVPSVKKLCISRMYPRDKLNPPMRYT